MSHFTINGKPAGYFIKVMEDHAERCKQAVAAGTITQQQAEQLTKAAETECKLT